MACEQILIILRESWYLVQTISSANLLRNDKHLTRRAININSTDSSDCSFPNFPVISCSSLRLSVARVVLLDKQEEEQQLVRVEGGQSSWLRRMTRGWVITGGEEERAVLIRRLERVNNRIRVHASVHAPLLISNQTYKLTECSQNGNNKWQAARVCRQRVFILIANHMENYYFLAEIRLMGKSSAEFGIHLSNWYLPVLLYSSSSHSNPSAHPLY